jgi:hypothetical protein
LCEGRARDKSKRETCHGTSQAKTACLTKTAFLHRITVVSNLAQLPERKSGHKTSHVPSLALSVQPEAKHEPRPLHSYSQKTLKRNLRTVSFTSLE